MVAPINKVVHSPQPIKDNSDFEILNPQVLDSKVQDYAVKTLDHFYCDTESCGARDNICAIPD